jgi:hypothetical protein
MSILDDIRNRHTQPTVEPRSDVLQDSLSQDSPPLDTTAQVEPPALVSQLERLEELLASFPEIASRVPVRLEVVIKDELDDLCNKEKITLETLLEAFYLICKDRESIMPLVLEEAKKRLKSRKEAGNIRSSLTKLSNLSKR